MDSSIARTCWWMGDLYPVLWTGLSTLPMERSRAAIGLAPPPTPSPFFKALLNDGLKSRVKSVSVVVFYWSLEPKSFELFDNVAAPPVFTFLVALTEPLPLLLLQPLFIDFERSLLADLACSLRSLNLEMFWAWARVLERSRSLDVGLSVRLGEDAFLAWFASTAWATLLFNYWATLPSNLLKSSSLS